MRKNPQHKCLSKVITCKALRINSVIILLYYCLICVSSNIWWKHQECSWCVCLSVCVMLTLECVKWSEVQVWPDLPNWMIWIHHTVSCSGIRGAFILTAGLCQQFAFGAFCFWPELKSFLSSSLHALHNDKPTAAGPPSLGSHLTFTL